VATSPLERPVLDEVLAHPLFWNLQAKVNYLGDIGLLLPVRACADCGSMWRQCSNSCAHKGKHAFITELEDEIDKALGGGYNEHHPAQGTSWARLLDARYPLSTDGWGKGHRAPDDEERSYAIYGGPAKGKQVKQREGLIAAGKPLGSHTAKEIRTVGLLKFIHNTNAHAGQHVSAGRFESSEAVQHYLLDPFPWLLTEVYKADQKHGVSEYRQQTYRGLTWYMHIQLEAVDHALVER